CERLVADQRAGAPDGVTEAERRLLPRIRHLPRLGEPRLELIQEVGFAALTQGGFELDGAVEMIVDRALPPARDQEELLDPVCLGLLDGVMNERLVDDRQHFLWHRLGCRKKSGPQSCDREDSFANSFAHEPLDCVPRQPRGDLSATTSPPPASEAAYIGGYGVNGGLT